MMGPLGSLETLLDETITKQERHYNFVFSYPGNESPTDAGIQRIVHERHHPLSTPLE